LSDRRDHHDRCDLAAATATPKSQRSWCDVAKPAAGDLALISPRGLAQLKRDLAVVVSAEALFILTDLCGLSPDDAIASAVHAARTLTEAAARRPA